MYKKLLFEILDKALIENRNKTEQYTKINERGTKLNNFDCWKIVREHMPVDEDVSLIAEDKYAEMLKGALQARGVPKGKILDILASRAKSMRVGKGMVKAATK